MRELSSVSTLVSCATCMHQHGKQIREIRENREIREIRQNREDRADREDGRKCARTQASSRATGQRQGKRRVEGKPFSVRSVQLCFF
jgi:hypothetical protein